jgi:hypothetical protein
MTGHQPTVNASTFRAWYLSLEAIVVQDPDDRAPGNRQRSVLLLHELVGMGLRQGAVRVVVAHSTGPSGFAHLTYRYPLAQEFDWDGEIELAWESGHALGRPEHLIAEIEAATGIPAEPDQTDHHHEEESPMNDGPEGPAVTQQTLAAWRAELVKIRGRERQRSVALPAETGRLLEIVGQALAQGSAALPASDIARIEELTSVQATFR